MSWCPGPLSPPGFSPPLPRAPLDTRAQQMAQAEAAGTLQAKTANQKQRRLWGLRGPIPASRNVASTFPRTRAGAASQAHPAREPRPATLGPQSLREHGRRGGLWVHRPPPGMSGSEAALLLSQQGRPHPSGPCPLSLQSGQPSNYGKSLTRAAYVTRVFKVTSRCTRTRARWADVHCHLEASHRGRACSLEPPHAACAQAAQLPQPRPAVARRQAPWNGLSSPASELQVAARVPGTPAGGHARVAYLLWEP